MAGFSYSLLHIVDNLHELLAEIVGLGHRLRLTIDAADGFGVGLTEVYPTIGEVDLHTIDIVDDSAVVPGKHLLHLDENSVDIGIRREVDTILSDLVVGEGLAQFTGRAALLCE